MYHGPMLPLIAPGRVNIFRLRPSGSGRAGGASTSVSTPGVTTSSPTASTGEKGEGGREGGGSY